MTVVLRILFQDISLLNFLFQVLKENLDLTEFWKNVDVLQRKYFEIPRVQIQAVLLHFRNNLRFADFVLDSKKLVRFVTHLPPKKRVSKLVSLLEKNLNQKLHLKNINCANKSSNRLIYKKELYQPLKLSVFDYSNYREIMRKNLKKHLSKSKVQYLYKSAFEKLHVGRKFFERNNYAQTKPLLSKQTGKGRSILKGFLERTQTSLLKNYFNESDLINKNIYSTFKNISLNSGVVVKTKRESMTTAKLLIEKGKNLFHVNFYNICLYDFLRWTFINIFLLIAFNPLFTSVPVNVNPIGSLTFYDF